jgi:hypothetical protein
MEKKMKNVFLLSACVAWSILTVTGCKKQGDDEPDKTFTYISSDDPSISESGDVAKPPIPMIKFVDPAVGYYHGYLLIRESEKTTNKQDSIRSLKAALKYFEEVERRFPDWKTSMVRARIQQSQLKLEQMP